MSLKHSPPNPPTPMLSHALMALREHVVKVANDCDSVLGLLDNIHTAANAYELKHRLKTLIGRDKFITKTLRRYSALLEPLELILMQLGE